MRVARTAAISMVAAATAMLTGCEKPPPAISVFSGTTTLNEPALCWSADSDNLGAGQCAQDILSGETTSGVPTLAVTAGNTIGISVDTVVAESGWTPALGGQRILAEPTTETYFRFTTPLGLPAEGIPLQIIAGQDTKIRGVWIVNLQPN